jgi:hypothetical protein
MLPKLTALYPGTPNQFQDVWYIDVDPFLLSPIFSIPFYPESISNRQYKKFGDSSLRISG